VITVIAIVVSYLIGSISFGYLAAKLAKGVDVREFGSGGTGTTNVLRTAGMPAAAITILGDFFKGVLVVVAAHMLDLPTLSVVLVGLAVVAGHNWPIFLRFKGGRGVATGFGVSLGLTWQISLALVILWALIILISRYVSLASVVVMVLYPIIIIITVVQNNDQWPLLIFAFVGCGTILYMHRKNIVRLVKGQESKIGQKVTV
jgi:acyl phosphate:glycerol-3-phosphate acyltransferase